MTETQKKLAKIYSFITYGITLLALIASLNVYFNFFDLQQQFNIPNDFITVCIIFLGTSITCTLFFFIAFQLSRERPYPSSPFSWYPIFLLYLLYYFSWNILHGLIFQ